MRESPAASSEPELIFEPDESCCRVFDRLLFVLFRLCVAYIADRLFKTPRDMGHSLRCVELRPKTPDACSHLFFAALGCCCGVVPSHLLRGFSACSSATLCNLAKCPAPDT